MIQVSAIEYCSREITALAKLLAADNYSLVKWDQSRESSSLAGASSLARIR